MNTKSRAVSFLLFGEVLIGVCLAVLFLTDKFLAPGPDTMFTGLILLSVFALAGLTLIGVPPLVWFAARTLFATRESRTALSIGVIVVGICLWSVVAAWIVFV
ncbi:hypothetical protein RF679_15670 [Undibacterium cyanobacteriorum]|uniref:Uncharacterized protein n=1 Tax=Undibacterium cyanobacteriorum TaxID=3073561 RepID=A0ABY9RFS7_9BURK|nr:hypothetical protein [Undibacterium sp. 20NA77.5]WMW80072.1 hypothetical protein RF679_15670 [Undibacterium sp. 20NA77.5]